MKTRDKITILVEKFLDGKTTNSEEQMLYDWFSENDVSEDWQPLKAMFAWYAEGMPEVQNEEQSDVQNERIEKQPQKWSLPLRHPRHIVRWASIGLGVAAMVAVMLIATLRPRESEFNIYEGSYIVEGGVRYEDLAYIESDIEAMLRRAENYEQQANDLLAWADTI